MNNNPLFTIITVVYNDFNGLKETIESVLAQTYSNYEYVIVDGKSNDNSPEMARSYKELFCKKGVYYKVISEPDNGIYDAMNKGTKNSNGQWLLFLNAGDILVSNDVLSKVSEYIDMQSNVLFGNTIYRYHDLYKKVDPPEMRCFENFDEICHQSTFIKNETMKALKYDCSYPIRGDYDFFLRLFKAGGKFKRIPVTISVFEIGGASSKGDYSILYEGLKVKYNDGFLSDKKYQNEKIKLDRGKIRYRVVTFIKKILPHSMVEKIMRRRYLARGYKAV